MLMGELNVTSMLPGNMPHVWVLSNLNNIQDSFDFFYLCLFAFGLTGLDLMLYFCFIVVQGACTCGKDKERDGGQQ